jgi:3-deoxy-D-manno-octulosonic-acid transferase
MARTGDIEGVEPLSLILYRAGVALLEPFTPGLLARRAEKGKEDAARLGERLGRASAPRPEGPLVWIHSVSVGESQSVLPLIARLRAERPDVAILSTSGTVTSAALLARRLPPGAIHQYAPLDTPGAARRFLDHWRPDLAIFVESELWPNLILGAKARGARLALLSARITMKTARGWARVGAAARRLVGAYDLVMPQDEASAERLAYFGAEIAGRLNLKLVGDPLPCEADDLAAMRAAIGDRPVILAASTHEGEEALIAGAARDAMARAAPEALLIIAPRHPERTPAVLAALGADWGPIAVRSRGEAPDSASRLYLADTLGEMGLFFRLADVVVMGGGFVPGVGGHNPMEPARLGAPVISGPEVFNAAELYQAMAGRGARIVPDAAALAETLAQWLSDPAAARAAGEAGRAFAEAQTASLDAAWRELEGLLP